MRVDKCFWWDNPFRYAIPPTPLPVPIYRCTLLTCLWELCEEPGAASLFPYLPHHRPYWRMNPGMGVTGPRSPDRLGSQDMPLKLKMIQTGAALFRHVFPQIPQLHENEILELHIIENNLEDPATSDLQAPGKYPHTYQ